VPLLIDTSLWIDFTRARSPQALKQFIAPHILDPDAVLADPVVFEVIRYATEQEVRQLDAQFETLPKLTTPADLWDIAAKFGQKCRKAGVNAGAMDLLIAVVAAHHAAELITFEADFQRIGRACGVSIKLLHRPG
jgi:predicted nucleic acid-binding protein